jgi:hypothetical protein
MGLLDRWLKPKKSVSKEAPKDNVTPIKRPPPKTAKELATERGEPYVNIVSMEIDANNLHQGAFELDWNDKFISNLVRAGYQMKPEDTDADIVDRWFQNVCRHVVMETWEQEEAMRTSGIYVKTTDLGNGRKEVS